MIKGYVDLSKYNEYGSTKTWVAISRKSLQNDENSNISKSSKNMFSTLLPCIEDGN